MDTWNGFDAMEKKKNCGPKNAQQLRKRTGHLERCAEVKKVFEISMITPTVPEQASTYSQA